MLQTATDAAELTVAESVRHTPGFYPRPRDPDEVIELVGLTEKAGARVKSLSGGQRRRLDVALGIIGRPELLFLDEPTTGFDPEARRQFWELIRHSRRRHHDPAHHPLPRRGRGAGRPGRGDRGRPIVAEGSPATLGGRAGAEATVRWDDANGPQERRPTRPRWSASSPPGVGSSPPHGHPAEPGRHLSRPDRTAHDRHRPSRAPLPIGLARGAPNCGSSSGRKEFVIFTFSLRLSC